MIFGPELTLVPSERHADEYAFEGVRAMPLGRFVRQAVELETGARPATPEITRLAAERHLRRGAAFAASIDDAIGLLRRAGVSAAELSKLPSARARFLAEVQRAVDELLATHDLRDERSDAVLAARALSEGRVDVSGLRRVEIRGLTRFHPADLALFEALHRRLRAAGAEGVTLVLPNLRGEHSALAVDRLAQSLEARWSALNDAPGLVMDEPRDAGDSKLTLIEAADQASEARIAVRGVLEALASGAAIDRIAIVPLDLSEAFLEPLRDQLALAGLPFTEPRGRPPIAGPKVHAALELMRQSHGPLARDALIDVLCMPGIRTERWFSDGAEETRYALLRELATLPLRVDRSRTELCEALAGRAEAADDEEAARRAGLALAGLRALLADLEAFATPAPREQLGRAWLTLFDDLGLLSTSPRAVRLALEAETAGKPELLRALGDNAQGARALATAITRSYEAARALGLGDEPVSPRALLEEVEAALEGASQRGAAARAGALSVARPHEVSGLDLDFVVICQASSENLDSLAVSSEIALGAEIREGLPASKRPPSSAEQRRFTLLALNGILSRSKRAQVSFGRRKGPSTSGPSRFFLALAAAGPEPEREPASPLAPGARRVVALADPSPATLRRARIDVERARFFLEPGAEPGAHTGRVATLAARVGGDAARPLALTAVERYLRCPYLGFAGTVLGASRDEVTGDAIGVRERGSLLHEALARALEAVRDEWTTASPAELERDALAAAEAFLFEHGASALRRAGLRTTLADVAAFVRWSLEHAELAFFEAERAFGTKAEWPPLALGELFVSGRIDRIDANSDRKRLRVIDYKTGKAPSRAQAASQLLQPWLYAAKVGVELGADEVEAGYLSLNRRDPDWVSIYEGPPDGEAIREAAERAVTAIERFRAGWIEPVPKDPVSCRRCETRDLCRRPLSAPAPEEGGE